jgi:DNA adenine methylase
MKFVGSKRRIATDILPIIQPKNGEDFIAPFVGGCNIEQHIQGKVYARDIHYELIEMWQAVQNGWEPPQEVSEELYKDIKDNPGKYPAHLVGYVGYGSFGAKFFGGYPRTHYAARDRWAEHYRDVMKTKIDHIIFGHGSYKDVNVENMVIYCDPPYKGSLGYGWTYYKREQQKFDHDHFWDWVRVQSKKNTVYVSEYSAPEDFTCIYEKQINQWVDKSKGYTPRVEKLWILKK